MELQEQERNRRLEKCRGQRWGHLERKIEAIGDNEPSADGSQIYISNMMRNFNADVSVVKKFKSDLRCLGGYSEDEEQNFWNNNSSLTFLNTEFLPTSESKEKSVTMDLNCAIEKSKPYTGKPMKSFENFFSWILSNKKDQSAEFFKSENQIICMKNALSKILKIPNGYNVMCKFFAVELNGVTYLLNEKGESYDGELFSNWGHKFKQFLSYGGNVEKGVNPNPAYRCVLSSQLGLHKIYFSSSLDCVNPDLYEGTLSDLSTGVSSKCIYVKANNQMKYLERFKMYEWCTRLVLSGTPQILIGYRDNNGVVRRLKLYNEEDLARKGKEYWNMNTSFMFLEKILSVVKQRIHSKPGTIFSFTKPVKSSYIKCEDLNVKDFPPTWFTEEFKCSE